MNKLLALTFLGAIQAYKIGLISDTHLKLDYDPEASVDTWCGPAVNGTGLKDDQIALLGRLGCDAPQATVEYIFQLFKKVNVDEPVDFIILTGDLVSHGVAQDLEDKGTDKGKKLYAQLKDTHSLVQSLFTKYFPTTPVFLSFGNNDCRFHDNVPFQEEKQEFYDFMWNLWFVNHTPNQQYATGEVQRTFKSGGYYSIDLEYGLSLVSLNTLIFNVGQYKPEIGDQAEEQLTWLEAQLSNPDKKQVLFYHMYAGGRIKHNDEGLSQMIWDEEYNKRYFEMMLTYKDRIILEVGAHDHWEDLRYYEDKDGNAYRNLLISTGVGMDHKQLPGFSTFEMKDYVPKNLIEYNLDVTKAYGMTEMPNLDDLPFTVTDFTKDYGLQDLTVEGIKSLVDNFSKQENFDGLKNYLSDRNGYDHKDSDQLEKGLELTASWSLISQKFDNADLFLCQSAHARNTTILENCYKNELSYIDKSDKNMKFMN